MEYVQLLSQRALECLAILKQPTGKEIRKQKSQSILGGVGTYFEEIIGEMNISMNVLRKLLQKEVYGIAGIFFQSFNVTHSVSFVSDNPTNEAVEKIREQGFEARFSIKGKLYQAKSKNHPKQRGLYIPESVLENFEKVIDDEERVFTKKIELDSLQVLEFMLMRSLELREKHGSNWYPIFSDKSISKDTGIEYDDVIKATTDLVGLICESYRMVTCRSWQKRYFLPSSKFRSAEELLAY